MAEETFYCRQGKHTQPILERVFLRRGKVGEIRIPCCRSCYKTVKAAKSVAARDAFGRQQTQLNHAEQGKITTKRLETKRGYKANV